jgi:hypothetical protein
MAPVHSKPSFGSKSHFAVDNLTAERLVADEVAIVPDQTVPSSSCSMTYKYRFERERIVIR